MTYNENGALSLTTTFDARVPELAVDRAAVDAKTDATFVTVAGQNINELSATTNYTDKALEFNAAAHQPERTLNATGGLTLHPEHQEIHLQQLALDTRGQQWQLAPGSETTVRYGGDAISVESLQLVSNGQRVTAQGAFGRSGDALHVTLENVELAAVDALLLREPQLSGRLTATGTVSGTKDAPRTTAEFKVTQGGFRDFHYESFNGTVDYAGKGLTVDTRLQQNATTYLTAKGYVPVAAFSLASAEERAATHAVDTRGRGSHRPSRSKLPDRSRPGAGVYECRDQRQGHPAGERGHHRFRRRSASERNDCGGQRVVHRSADRRELHEPAGAHRSAARQGPHRQHRGARQPSERPLDYRRPRSAREAARRPPVEPPRPCRSPVEAAGGA